MDKKEYIKDLENKIEEYKLKITHLENDLSRTRREYEASTQNYFELFPESGYESVTLSCIINTREKNIGKLIEKLASKGYLISNGYGKLKEKTFRIGHMGEWTLNGIIEVLDIIGDLWSLEK